MKPKAIIKITVDIVMTIMLLVLMAYRITGERHHEWIGVGMFALFIAHQILNLSWYRNMVKGKYTAFRVYQAAINFLLLLCIVGLIVSGMILSRHVFTFLPISGGLSFARMLHLICAYWGYILISIHIGLHWGMIMGMSRKAARLSSPSPRRAILIRTVAVIIAGYGAYLFIARQIPQYMLFIIQFVFFDYEQSAVLFFIDYLAIMGLFVFLGHYSARLIQRKSSKKTQHSRATDNGTQV